MASGVKLNQVCTDIFQRLKMGGSKKEKKDIFMVMKMSEDLTEIVVDEDERYKGIEDFHCLLRHLPEDDGRYVIFDYPCKSKSGMDVSKLVLVFWCPEKANVKKKMLYASSKSAVKKMGDGEIPDIQCNCIDDITDKDIVDKVIK